MKKIVRVLLVLPVAVGLSACIDATVPRLPPGEEPNDSTGKPGAGYIGQEQQPASGG